MRAILLSLTALLSMSTSFENKTDAIDHLNSLNIWVAGSPKYALDKKGILKVSLDIKGAKPNYFIPLENVTVESKSAGNKVNIIFKCESGNCIKGSQGKSTAKASEVSLLLKSAFATDGDADDYIKEYPTKAASIVDAIAYLQRFYK